MAAVSVQHAAYCHRIDQAGDLPSRGFTKPGTCQAGEWLGDFRADPTAQNGSTHPNTPMCAASGSAQLSVADMMSAFGKRPALVERLGVRCKLRPGGVRRHPGHAAQPCGASALEEPATAHARGPCGVFPPMACRRTGGRSPPAKRRRRRFRAHGAPRRRGTFPGVPPGPPDGRARRSRPRSADPSQDRRLTQRRPRRRAAARMTLPEGRPGHRTVRRASSRCHARQASVVA
jgi:hypothetical protein